VDQDLSHEFPRAVGILKTLLAEKGWSLAADKK
jgi:hypothetical protein